MNVDQDLRDAQARMQPGLITLNGFLGIDTRPLAQILCDDDAIVNRLGITHKQIAQRLRYFTRLALNGYGTPCREGDFEVVIIEVRGTVLCPFGEHAHFHKGEVRLKHLKTGERLLWTPLQVHLIGMHGFYEGKGSLYRIEPEMAKKILGI